MNSEYILLGVAALNVITAGLALLNRRDVKESRKDIHLLEKNTNSIKDALVASVAKEQLATGRAEGRAEGEMKAASLAQGQKEGDKAKGLLATPKKTPVPVKDDRVGDAIEAIAKASDTIAKK